MIILLDTSTATCRLWLNEEETERYYEWDAGRQLADGLLGFLRNSLKDRASTWDDIRGIVAYRGPGSFTGLRIGLTVLNTIAEDRDIPIVGTTEESWRSDGMARLAANENDLLVMPLYGRAPNITTPRK